MRNGCRICRVVNLVLLLLVLGMGYIILKPSNIESLADGRTAVLLSGDERDLVLTGMRTMLETVQNVLDAAIDGDLKAAGAAAAANGVASVAETNVALIGRVPVEFMALGMDTHRAFDTLGETAQGTSDPMVVLAGLAEIVNSCTTCHASYRLGLKGADVQE